MNPLSVAPQGARGRLVWLFALALAVRLIALLLLAPHHAAAGSSAWNFGGEAACLGEALYLGKGLADPWAHGTGLSGWLTPPYPALLAALMWMFDGINPAWAFALFSLQSLASAATCVFIARMGANLGERRAGWWGGLFFALYPPSVWNAMHVVWDTTFVAFGTLACLSALTRPGALDSVRARIVLGLGWGALVFLNPAPLALLPGVFGYIYVARKTWGERALVAGTLLVGIAAVCAPWMLRNQRVLGTSALRPNFGVELRLGNNPESNGHPAPFKFHPSHVPEELALYRELGERDYARNCSARALDWMRAEPAQFLVLSLKRVQFFWLGDIPWLDQRRNANARAVFDPNSWAKFFSFALLGVLGWIGALRWRGPPEGRVLFLGILGCFGLAYYVTHVSERYRFPIDPLLALLAATCVLRWLKSRRKTPQIS
jgi:4-amino-4-deoxy-L-arabinose transferase-like glycosyltransferase